MNVDDFRQTALNFPNVEESSHMGQPDFRVGGRIFATLAMQELGFGNLMLNPDLQKSLVISDPQVFLPVKGGWGRMGATHIRLSAATEHQLVESLNVAYQLRVEKNRQSRGRSKGKSKKTPPKKKPSLE